MDKLIFENIYEEHKASIFRLCRVLVYETAGAEDLFQEVIINIWKSLPNFKGKSQVKTWLYRITVNTSITFNAKYKRGQQNQEHYLKEMSQENTASNSLMDNVVQAISQLEHSDKAVIGLYLEGFSYKEIAQMLGLSQSNVGVKLNRIKLKLKNILNA